MKTKHYLAALVLMSLLIVGLLAHAAVTTDEADCFIPESGMDVGDFREALGNHSSSFYDAEYDETVYTFEQGEVAIGPNGAIWWFLAGDEIC